MDPCTIVKHHICGHTKSTAMQLMNPNHEQTIGNHVKSTPLDRILASVSCKSPHRKIPNLHPCEYKRIIRAAYQIYILGFRVGSLHPRKTSHCIVYQIYILANHERIIGGHINGEQSRAYQWGAYQIWRLGSEGGSRRGTHLMMRPP